MGADYEPATVAVATVRGVEGVRVFRTNGVGGADAIWFTAEFIRHERVHHHCDVTDVRPLVVLDVDAEHLRDFLKCARDYDFRIDPSEPTPLSRIADQIEAQTKPPRIPEPGLWGVVEAHNVGHRIARKWVHYGTGWRDAFDYHEDWDGLIDPTLIREGVES